jgi:hypothetical protein
MSIKNKANQASLSEEQIDDMVVSQADEDSAWSSAVRVRRGKRGSYSLPADLAERAAFLAHLHRAPGIEEWLNRVIRERIEIEEVAYAAAKREIGSKGSAKARPSRPASSRD